MSDSKPVLLDSALIDEAKELGIEVTDVLEAELRTWIDKKKAARRWADENREFIEAHNARIERDGLWHERLRDA